MEPKIIIDAYGIKLCSIYQLDFNNSSTTFFSSPEDQLQIGSISIKPDRPIKAHGHNPVDRRLTNTSEVLVLLNGNIMISFYDTKSAFLLDLLVESRSVISLHAGGHGFRALSNNVELLEIKQGPYISGQADKYFIPDAEK